MSIVIILRKDNSWITYYIVGREYLVKVLTLIGHWLSRSPSVDILRFPLFCY